jgi:hypothetical protein
MYPDLLNPYTIYPQLQLQEVFAFARSRERTMTRPSQLRRLLFDIFRSTQRKPRRHPGPVNFHRSQLPNAMSLECVLRSQKADTCKDILAYVEDVAHELCYGLGTLILKHHPRANHADRPCVCFPRCHLPDYSLSRISAIISIITTVGARTVNKRTGFTTL